MCALGDENNRWLHVAVDYTFSVSGIKGHRQFQWPMREWLGCAGAVWVGQEFRGNKTMKGVFGLVDYSHAVAPSFWAMRSCEVTLSIIYYDTAIRYGCGPDHLVGETRLSQ
jgi:hypothetical protein